MTKSFDRQEGLGKLKEMIESIGTCMFLTKNSKDDNHVRPMATIKVEENGTLWFFTKAYSGKINELHANNDVELFYSHPGKESYVSVAGKTTIETSREKIKELWSPIAKAWFPDGVDDPEISLLKVEVDSAYYWDGGSNKMVSLFKQVVAAVTGTQVANGEEGALVS